jgi:hypothetical protein
VIVSILCIAGACSFFLQFSQKKDNNSQIVKLVLKQRGEDSLPLPLFAEMLSLSCDHSLSYSDFNIQNSEEALRLIGIFKKIKLRKYKPETVVVEYELYRPSYIWGEYTNTLINDQGLLMPYFPYFTPKKLPTLYLDSERSQTYFEYLQKLHAFVSKGNIEMVDLRGMNAISKAKRQVILQLNQEGEVHILRLDPVFIEEQFSNYFTLLPYFKKTKQRSFLIDLRFPEAAYITPMF